MAVIGQGVGGSDDGPGSILRLITSGEARTRTAISQTTGLSRSTVTQRLERLFGADLICEDDPSIATGGRPSRALRLNPRAALVVSVDVGEERTRVAVTDLEATILAERVDRLDLREGPEALLDKITTTARVLLREHQIAPAPVAGLGLGLPAPVAYDSGRVMGWSILSGWEDFDIRTHLGKSWPVPVLIDNDVNLLTLAEHRRYWPDERHLFYLKAGTGIGSGMIVDGVIDRGAQGAAGDIGHARLGGYSDPPCRCGNLGCLEALVGGWAIARDLRAAEQLDDSHDARDVAEHLRRGDTLAVTLMRTAGRIMGEAVAFATSLLNPNVIVIGGQLSTAGDHLVAGVREVVYQRTLPLATRQLRIVPARFRSRVGITGAAYLVRDHVLDPGRLDRMLATDEPIFVAVE